MTTKYSKEAVPLNDLKINSGKVIKHSTDTQKPISLTSRGRGISVVQSVEEYEKTAEVEELAFVKALAQGLVDVRDGNSIDLNEARKKLGL